MEKTLKYYKENAESYISTSLHYDMSTNRHFFEKYLKENSLILDLGCGSGRDSFHFAKKHKVIAIDPIEEFVSSVKEKGIEAYVGDAETLSYENYFDGIWACASLLHVKEENLEKSFSNCYKALKKDGVMFCSFKYGDFIGYENDRYFIYLDEQSLKKYIGEFKIIDVMIIQDEIRKDELNWINVVLKK